MITIGIIIIGLLGFIPWEIWNFTQFHHAPDYSNELREVKQELGEMKQDGKDISSKIRIRRQSPFSVKVVKYNGTNGIFIYSLKKEQEWLILSPLF